MISYQNVIDLYFWYYDVRYHSRPTWKAQDGRQLKRLIRAHSAEEVVTRLCNMFGGQLEWAAEPFTWNLFVHSFDALVPVLPKTVKARDLALLAEELERQGR